MPPLNVIANATFGTAINVSWSPVPEEHHKGILLGYRIYYQEYDWTGPLWPMRINNTGLVESLELMNLNLSSNYSIQVAGYTSIGVGNLSDVIFGMSGEYGMCYFVDFFMLLFFGFSFQRV